jgi:hypothetical protein
MVHDLEVLSRAPTSAPRRPPLLMIHGARHPAWCWEPWLKLLSVAGWPAHALSLRGHGASEGSVRGASLADYVDDVCRRGSTPRCNAQAGWLRNHGRLRRPARSQGAAATRALPAQIEADEIGLYAGLAGVPGSWPAFVR